MQLGNDTWQASIRDSPLSPVPDRLKEHAILHSVPWLDRITGGIGRSEVALLDSSDDFVLGLTSHICVEAVTNFDREMVFVDGGNSIDPFGIARICKSKGLDANQVLSSISMARAFTAYQLTSLINTRLEDIIEETEASTLIVSCLLDLFFDKDMPWNESFQLIKRSLGEIKKLTHKHNLATVITNQGFHKTRHKRALRSTMYNTPDKTVILESRKAGMKVILPRKGIYYYRYQECENQSVLDRFCKELGYGEDCCYI